MNNKYPTTIPPSPNFSMFFFFFKYLKGTEREREGEKEDGSNRERVHSRLQELCCGIICVLNSG